MRKAQDYVAWNVEDCRMAFRLQTRMLDCRANMPTRYQRDLICRACRPDPTTGLEGQDETQEHLEVCKGYGELWQGLGPLTPQSRVKYFLKVKNKRMKNQQWWNVNTVGLHGAVQPHPSSRLEVEGAKDYIVERIYPLCKVSLSTWIYIYCLECLPLCPLSSNVWRANNVMHQ